MESAILKRMISYFGSDIRRINHALKVYAFAKSLSGDLPDAQRQPLLLAAILHDIGIKNAELKYQSSAGKHQELEGPPVAREILESENIPQNIVDRVCYLIGNHHSYDKIDGADFQILIESDFLVNGYEDHLSSVAVKTFQEKYFKTDAGKKAVSDMYDI